MTDTHDAKLNQRLNRAWARFGSFKQELTDKGVPLHLRFRLFHPVVKPTVLYDSSSWVMTCAQEAALTTTQMKMLRTILGRRRLKKALDEEPETWVAWIQRVTEEVRQPMETHSLPHWLGEQCDRRDNC